MAIRMPRTSTGLFHEMTDQRESEESVRDSGAIRRSALAAFEIHVNPLAVFGGSGESVDAVLRDGEPLGNA